MGFFIAFFLKPKETPVGEKTHEGIFKPFQLVITPCVNHRNMEDSLFFCRCIAKHLFLHRQ